MEEHQSFLHSRRGCMVEATSIFLTICVTMIASTIHQSHNDYFSCNGGLGAGFPASFLCDYSGGGSPISSAGKIDLADFPYISPQGFFVDILFYSALLWTAWLIRYSVYHKELRRREYYDWIAFISIGYIACFLLAFILFQVNRLYLKVPIPPTPTPTTVSPTPIAGVKNQETSPAFASHHVLLDKGEQLVGIAMRFAPKAYDCNTIETKEHTPYTVCLIRCPIETDVEIDNGG